MPHVIVVLFTSFFQVAILDDLNQSDFLSLANTDSYIDKSLLIENFISSEHKYRMILAPSGYGKSTNLRMLEAFFQDSTEADEYLIRDPKKTAAYGIFENLKIARADISRDHFGKYRVVYFDFGSLVGFQDFDSFIDAFRRMIRSLFSKNKKYLGTDSDTPLGLSLMKDCTNPKSKAVTLKSCGEVLTQLLRFHSEKPCIVLIDDFHAPYQFMNRTTNNELELSAREKICEFLEKFIKYLTKDNDCVGKSYFTGTSIDEKSMSSFNYFILESIFMNNYLLKHYGLSQEDVIHMTKVYGLDERVMDNLQKSPEVQRVSFCNKTIVVHSFRAVIQYLTKKVRRKGHS